MTASQSRHAGIASPALLMADPARAAMLTVLLDDRRLAAALAEARTCYDHLAGRAGVELLDSMLRAGMLAEISGDTDLASVRYRLTQSGASRLASFGINPDPPKISRRRFAGACLDWTQRRPHLGGALAAAITAQLFELGWIERGSRSRSVRITPAGVAGLTATFGWEGSATAA